MFSMFIGNPPFINAWAGHDNAPEQREYLSDRDSDFLIKHWDLVSAFLCLSKNFSERSAFVLPTGLLTQPHGEPIRKLAKKSAVFLKDYTGERQFKDASVDVFLLSCDFTQPVIDGIAELLPLDDGQPRLFNISDVFEDQGTEEYVPNPVPFASLLRGISSQLGSHLYLNYGAQVNPKEKGGSKSDFIFASEDGLMNPKPYSEAKHLKKGGWMLETESTLIVDYQAEKLYGPRVSEFFESEKLVFMEISSEFPPLWSDDTGLYLNHSVVIGVPHAALPQKFAKDFGFTQIGVYSVQQIQFLLMNRFTRLHYLRHLKRSNHNYPAPVRQILIPNVPPEELDKMFDLEDLEASISKLDRHIFNMMRQYKRDSKGAI